MPDLTRMLKQRSRSAPPCSKMLGDIVYIGSGFSFGLVRVVKVHVSLMHLLEDKGFGFLVLTETFLHGGNVD